MKYQHQDLANGKWAKLSLVEQMANIGSEVERTIAWREKANPEYSRLAFYRALELVDLSLDATKVPPTLRELTRLRECLVDYFAGDNLYKSSDELWRKYFYAFNYATALRRQRRFATK